jgi:site-specific DNA-methyltransferase (adenine-specific)
VEFAVWFKKRGGKTFNANCKNTVFTYSIMRGKKRIHPTQKPLDLFKELILDNTNEGDLVFDPCAGGMTTAMACAETNRNFICCEINDEFYNKGIELLEREKISFEKE